MTEWWVFITIVLFWMGPDEPVQQVWLGVNAAFSIANLIIVVTVVWKLSSKLTSLEEGREINFRELQELKAQVLGLIKEVALLTGARRRS